MTRHENPWRYQNNRVVQTDHMVKVLIQASKKWIVFSAAHPGQDGEGHVGPSMKTRKQWINDFTAAGAVVVDVDRDAAFQAHALTKHLRIGLPWGFRWEFEEKGLSNPGHWITQKGLLEANAVVFRKV